MTTAMVPFQPPAADPAELTRAHSAAAAAAAACADPGQAANSYAAALRSMGFGSCAARKGDAAATCPLSPAPPGANATVPTHVDSVATFWVVNSMSMLHRITDPSPGMGLDTADGGVPVEAVTAVGVALVYVRHVSR